MPDRGAEARHRLPVARGADGEQGDLVVEVHEALDDHPGAGHPAAGHRVLPGRLDVGRRPHRALALAGGGHHRLDHAREADGVGAGAQLLQRVAEPVGAGRQPEGLGGQPADALAVHGQPGRPRGRHHPLTRGLELDQRRGGDGLDLGDDDVGPLGLHQCPQLVGVAHGDGAGVVGDLVAGRVVVPVDGDGLHAEPLQRDEHLLGQLAAAQQHHAGGRRGQGRAQGDHGQQASEGPPGSAGAPGRPPGGPPAPARGGPAPRRRTRRRRPGAAPRPSFSSPAASSSHGDRRPREDRVDPQPVPRSSTRSPGRTSARTARPSRWETPVTGCTVGGTSKTRPRCSKRWPCSPASARAAARACSCQRSSRAASSAGSCGPLTRPRRAAPARVLRPSADRCVSLGVTLPTAACVRWLPVGNGRTIEGRRRRRPGGPEP